MSTKKIINIVDLNAEYKLFRKSIDKELKQCFNSQQWVLGKKVVEFEKKAAGYLGVKNAIGLSSGTEALVLALRALAIKLKGKEFFDKKDEIITTPFTFIATAEAIARSGATPVFVDVCPDTFNIDPKAIKKAVTKNTVGILPVHLYGLSCDMNEISSIARKNKLFIVEDTAQAFGARHKARKLGTIGDCGAFSFFPSKTLGCCGDGGMVTTNNKTLAELVKNLRNHGQLGNYDAVHRGYNARLDSIQAAVLLAKIKGIDKLNNLRRKIASRYNAAFKDINQIDIPYEPKDARHVYALYTIKVSTARDRLLSYLNSKGIAARVYYPRLLTDMKAFKGCFKLSGALANARRLSKTVLTLPLHPFLTKQEIARVIRLVSCFFQN